MHSKLEQVWGLLTRQESGGEDARIGTEKIKELLCASFDWDASLTDASSALAALGKDKDGMISYDDMVKILLDGRFRT
eukprot:12412442-Karenia_brevis.AAC.1